MKEIIRWEEPPASLGRGAVNRVSRWDVVADQLRQRRGEWALIFVGVGQAGSSLTAGIGRGGIASFAPLGDFARVQLTETLAGHACWYPQMGGYVSHAVVVIPEGDTCADVYVWHDGDFPLQGSEIRWNDKTGPVELHHCDGGQFVTFGRFIEKLQDAAAGEPHV